MKIVFVSGLSGSVSAGPSWSVPSRIKAQEGIDNVLWINLTTKYLPHWKDVKAYHAIKEFEILKLECLPVEYRVPDVVVFEGFYCRKAVNFSKQLRKERIPYIIVPRGSLTWQARHNSSRWKKDIAHWLWFDSFVSHALAVQYLTEKEKEDSAIQKCRNSFVLPNGITPPTEIKEQFSVDGVRAIFIGRIDVYHKGLDILLEACSHISSELRKAGFSLKIYGPQNQDFEKVKLIIHERNLQDIVSLMGEISGTDKAKAILEADLFVLTSRFEGHPMGLVEALSFGLPAFVTPGTNMAEEIKASNAGWVASCEVNFIAQTLKKAIEEKNLFSIKSKNALELSKGYNWELLAKKFHEKIEELI